MWGRDVVMVNGDGALGEMLCRPEAVVLPKLTLRAAGCWLRRRTHGPPKLSGWQRSEREGAGNNRGTRKSMNRQTQQQAGLRPGRGRRAAGAGAGTARNRRANSAFRPLKRQPKGLGEEPRKGSEGGRGDRGPGDGGHCRGEYSSEQRDLVQ